MPKKCTCWKGYSRVPGTKPCTPGSCGKNKMLKKFAEKRKGR